MGDSAERSEKFPEQPKEPTAPAGKIAVSEVLRAGVQRELQRRLAKDRRSQFHEVSTFDLRNFELLEQANYRELTPEDLPLVGDLYRACEMDPDIFYLMAQGDFENAYKLASAGGGMIHSWSPSSAERAIHETPEFRKICPMYISCEDEFRSFLDGTHGRAANFRAFGMFGPDGELIAIACCFVPPDDQKRLSKHARQVRRFLKPKASWKRIFAPRNNSATAIRELAQHRSRTTAEFYLILQKKRGAATFVCERMIQQLVKEGIPITDMVLQRYGSMAMVFPEMDQQVGHGGKNVPSGEFFEERGFNDCAELTNRREVALRDTRAHVFVGVQPTWTVMHAPFRDVISGSHSEFVHLHNKAEEARTGLENSPD